MAKVVLNKSGLQKEQEHLKLYRKVLPSLDLKRRQLLGEQRRAERESDLLSEELGKFADAVAKELPMLGAAVVDFGSLLSVREVKRDTENVVGVLVPVLDSVEFDQVDYALLAKPHWVDAAIERFREWTQLRARVEIAAERVELLEAAARKVTQRVNLFEKILIPNAEENIRKIRVHLADAERAAVVRSKIAKARSRRHSAQLQDAGKKNGEEELAP